MRIMAQISLYLDGDTISQIEIGAKADHISKSKYVAKIIREHEANVWPEYFMNLYGSISDKTFAKPPELEFSDDLKRENL
jgi:hypothetical protein